MSWINKGFSLKRFHEDTVAELKSAGLDPKRRNGKGETLLGLAMKNKLKRRLDPEACKEDKNPLLMVEDASLKEIMRFSESVDVTQFPILTATLVEKQVIDGFESFDGIVDQLVTPFQSKLQVSKIPGADLSLTIKDIEPGMPYHHDADIAEKYVQIEGKKRGDILDITEEALMFDQTGLIMREARRFGEQAAIDREKKHMYTIQDATVNNVNYYAFYPSGSRVALYSGTVAGTHPYSNLIDDRLQHWTDLDSAKTQFTTMRDSRGEPIMIDPKILLVPKAQETNAKRLIQNTLLPAARIGNTVPGDSQNEANPFANAYTVLSSPYLDIVSTAYWYLGDFKKQFLEKVVYPVQVLTRVDNKNDYAWERDIIAQYKIRHYTQVGATNYEYVVKSRGTYGVCPDESYCSSWDDVSVP
jgi:hypothetical protein